MAKRRKKAANTNKKLMAVAATIERDFTDVEEDFFRAGMAEQFDDVETTQERQGLWSRLVRRLAA